MTELGELKPKDKEPTKKVVGLLMLEAGTEFIFLIAVPLIAGLFLGKWLDKKYNHHFFVIIGILLGLTVTCFAVYRRIKDYRKML
jgi:hypothetical protein